MHKEYILVKSIRTIGHKNAIQILDRVTALNFREAKQDFKKRNNIQKELKKADLMVCEVREYWV